MPFSSYSLHILDLIALSWLYTVALFKLTQLSLNICKPLSLPTAAPFGSMEEAHTREHGRHSQHAQGPPRDSSPLPPFQRFEYLLRASFSLAINSSFPLAELHRLPPTEHGTRQTKHQMYFSSCLEFNQEDGATRQSEMSTRTHFTLPERYTVY